MTSKPDQPGLASHAVVRHALHFYWRLARGMTLGVRGAVIDRDERVLLIRHTYLPGWHLPGGGVEVGETAPAALARELEEEGCIRVSDMPSLHGVFFNDRVSRRDHVLVYVVRSFEVLGAKNPDREIAEARFFPWRDLPSDTAPSTRRRLEEIATGTVPAATW